MLSFYRFSICQKTNKLFLGAIITIITLSLFSLTARAQNNSLSFDGTNDFVAIPALGNGYTQFTIETWFNASSIANSAGFNGIFNSNNWVVGDVHFQINNTKIELAVNGSTLIDVPYNAITVNTWHHLAATYNSVTKKINVYINGTLLQSATLATTVPANFTTAQMGAYTTQRYFAGMFDEYRIWSTERSITEIRNNMFTSLAGNETGLLASYNFNQGSAGDTNTGITSVINSKGSNNGTLNHFALTGVISNWIASTTPSIIANNCLNFNGTNNYVNCGSVNPTKFTIEAWALPNAVSADQAVVSTLFTSANTGCELHIGSDSYPYITIRNGTAWLDIKATAKAVAGVWIHLAATFDGSTCILFVNGIKVASQTSISYYAGTNALFLGVRSGPEIYFSGKIDDVRIWNRVVTETNLLDSLYTVLDGSEKGLLAHYNFNQGTAGGTNTGLTTLLSSTGTNHGTLVNFTLSGATSNWVTAFLPSPVSHVTNFAGSLVSNKIKLTWTDAIGTVIPEGYLIYASKTNSFTNPVDGVLPADDNDLSDGTGNIRVIKGIQTYNGWLNEDINSVYYFRIYSFTNPGLLIKYFSTEPVPSVQVTSKQLFTQVTIPSFKSSSQSLWGDYNNDGWLDYIASGYNDGWSTTYLNNKNNTFSANLAFNKENVGPDGWVDINYDGNLDIAAYKRIYLNGSNGALFAEVAMPEPEKYVDIDKDGDLDLIGYSYPSINLSVLRNDGALGFTEVNGNYFKDTDGSFEILDYNNDGYPDIVISGRYSVDYKLSTTVYKNDGTGKYTEQKQFVLDGLSQAKIKTGDLNSDGRDDIILTGLNNLGKFNLIIYINTDGNSFSKLSFPMQAGIDQGSTDMVDINNNGLYDIIFAGGNSDYSAGYFKVFKNNGDLTFSEIYDLAGLSSPASVDITDFNNDGAIDVIVQGNIILQNIATSGNLVPQKITVASASQKDNGVQFQWNGSDDKTSSTGLTYNLRIGRTEGASDVQSHTSLPTGQRKQLKPGNMGSNAKYFRPLGPGTYYWSIQAVDNSYKGGPFSTEQSIVVDSVPAGKLQAISSDKLSLKIKWTNGNGQKRALFCKIGTDGTTKPVNNKTYTASVTFGEGNQIGNSGWYCVYNGIGDSVSVQNLTEYNTYVFQAFEYFGNKGAEKYMLKMADGNPALFGTSGFTKQTDISIAGSSKNIFSFGDYNNDGLVDFFVNNNYTGLRIFKNKGNNTFELQTISGIEILDAGAAVWADFNNDGWLDIIVSGERYSSWWTRPKSIRLYRNDQNNVFTDLSGGTAVIPGLTESAIAAADYDNDGDIDFFVNGTESLWDAASPVMKSKIYRNNNTLTDCFTEQTGIDIPSLNNGAAVWGDFNNDGWKDLLLSGASQDGFYYLYKLQNVKDNSFSQTELLKIKSKVSGSDFNNSDIKTLDFDKDGNLDFLIFIGNNNTDPDKAADTTIIFRNNGDGSFAAFNNIEFPKYSASNRIDIGDYNNDKAEDIIMSTSVNPNMIRLFQNNYPEKSFSLNPDFNFTWATLPNTESFQDMNSTSFCDYDNDGDADILTTNYDRLYFISNNRVMKSGTFPVNKTPEAPSNVIATQEPGKLIVNWNPVTSDETSSLSYNVILSTGSLLLNSPGSNITSGKLLVPVPGNAGLKTFAIFNELPVGTYSISVQAVDGAFTGGAWSVPVVVELKNTKAFFTFDTVCYKAATKLSDLSTSTKNIASRKWKYNNTVFSTDSVAHFVFPNSGTGNITLVITDGEGTKDSVTHAILIKARPTASYSATTVCLGETTAFVNNSLRNGSGTILWSWNYDNGDPASTDSIPLNKVYGLSRTYKTKLIVTSSNSCADTLSKDVIVGAIPNAITSVNGKTTFCQGDSVLLTVEENPLYTYQWKLDNNDLTNSNMSSYKIKQNSGAYSVKVTNSVANCVATSVQTSVTVNPVPVSPFISVSGPVTFCQGDSVILSVSNNPGETYQWKLNGGAVGNNSHLYTAKTSGTYSLDVSNLSGCSTSSSNTIIVIVNAKPSLPAINISGPTTFCQGESIELSVTNNPSYSYQWNNNNSGITGSTSNIFVANNTGNYSLHVSNSNNCNIMSANVAVNVLTIPVTPSISASGPVQFCQGDSVNLNVSNTTGYNYQWKLNGGAVGTNSNQFSAKNGGTFNLTVSNTNGCSVTSSNSVIVTVKSLPTVSAVSLSGSAQFCEGGNVLLTIPLTEGYFYAWRNETGLISNATTNNYLATTSGKYELNISNTSGCMLRTAPVNVVVMPAPVKPVIDPGNYQKGKCLGEIPIRLNVNNATIGNTYQWYRNGVPVSDATSTYIEGFLQQGIYKVEASLGSCSVQSDTLNVIFDDAPAKPYISAQGPTVWYLVCSNIDASKYKWYYNGTLITGSDKYIYVANRNLGIYNVSISNAKGCFTMSDAVTIPTGVTSVEEIDPFSGMIVYPNPTSGLFTIEMENQIFGALQITINDQSGKEIVKIRTEKSTEYFSKQVDMRGCSKGIYIIRTVLNNHTDSRKTILK